MGQFGWDDNASRIETLNICGPAGFKAVLQKRAKRNHRSLSAECLALIEAALAAEMEREGKTE